MKILVTGSRGFVGQNLMKTLNGRVIEVEKGYDLRKQADVNYLLRINRPDIVIHLAARVGGIGANQLSPGTFIYDNLAMGVNLIEASLRNDVQKFIMLGTVCMYPKFAEVPFKEENIWKGYPEETNAPYGIAKKTLIEMLLAYHKQYGFNSINLIPTNLYGPHEHFNLMISHVIPAIIMKVDRAIEEKCDHIFIWGTGEASREFLYVDDCVQAISNAIELNPGPDPINIGTGKEIKISELVNLICNIMEFNGEIIYQTDKPDGQPRRCLDISKAAKLLNFEAKVDLETGLKQTIEWYYGSKT